MPVASHSIADMTQRYRVTAEFDIIVPTGSEDAATQLGERLMDAWTRGEVAAGNIIQTGGVSPEVAAREMLDNPPQRGTILALALLVVGQQKCGVPLGLENWKIRPVAQSED